MGRVGGVERWERRDERILEVLRPTSRRRLHRGDRDHLHQVVDHHIAESTDGIVEVAAVSDPEVFRHGDLHGLDVVAVPYRFEPRVREPQVQDLFETHLADVVVDTEQLRLIDVLVEFGCQGPGRFEIVAERLLDDHASVVGEVGVVEPLDDRGEQERRDLEVETGTLALARRYSERKVITFARSPVIPKITSQSHFVGFGMFRSPSGRRRTSARRGIASVGRSPARSEAGSGRRRRAPC